MINSVTKPNEQDPESVRKFLIRVKTADVETVITKRHGYEIAEPKTEVELNQIKWEILAYAGAGGDLEPFIWARCPWFDDQEFLADCVEINSRILDGGDWPRKTIELGEFLRLTKAEKEAFGVTYVRHEGETDRVKREADKERRRLRRQQQRREAGVEPKSGPNLELEHFLTIGATKATYYRKRKAGKLKEYRSDLLKKHGVDEVRMSVTHNNKTLQVTQSLTPVEGLQKAPAQILRMIRHGLQIQEESGYSDLSKHSIQAKRGA